MTLHSKTDPRSKDRGHPVENNSCFYGSTSPDRLSVLTGHNTWIATDPEENEWPKKKREQSIIHQGNIQFLEEKQVEMGMATGVSLMNELELTKERLSEVQKELNELEQKLREGFNLNSDDLDELVTMSQEEIITYADYLFEKKGENTKPFFLIDCIYQKKIVSGDSGMNLFQKAVWAVNISL